MTSADEAGGFPVKDGVPLGVERFLAVDIKITKLGQFNMQFSVALLLSEMHGTQIMYVSG